jgi:PAS domain-containing protein
MASLGWGVITVDLNGVITFINRVACGLSGWKQENVGELIEIFEIRNGKRLMLKPLMQAMQRIIRYVARQPYSIKRKDDDSKYLLMSSGHLFIIKIKEI